MPKGFRSLWLALFLISLIFLSSACSFMAGKPTVVISSPPHGSQFHVGDDVSVTSTATDSSGISRVELYVDGSIVRTDSPPGKSQSSFTLIQTWKAVAGSHTLSVRAYNAADNASDPAIIAVTVVPETAGPGTAVPSTAVAEQSTPVQTVAPADTPASPLPAASSTPAACTNIGTFVADVTIPDGTVLAAGQAFNKIWRLRNAGTCNWGAGYQFVFVSGKSMATTTTIAVPKTAPGATAEMLVAMTAPAPAGSYTSHWRLRTPTGTYFGATVYVAIKVLGASPTPGPTKALTPTNTPNPTNTPPPSCDQAPLIASFTASPNPITTGGSTTLSWGAVTGADEASIDNGIGGVGTPGSVTVNPSSTTTYTLTATGCGGTSTRQVTVTVNSPQPSGVQLIYDFLASAPSAQWYSGIYPTSSGYLTWGTQANTDGTNPEGFMRIYTGALEDGSSPQSLETHPKWVTDGFIVGRYTIPGTLQAGTHFRTKYGFIAGAGGQVQFVAGIIVGSNPAVRFLDVTKTRTGSLNDADVDLSAYAGQSNVLIYFEAIGRNTTANQCWAVWVNPRLEK